MIGRGHSGRTWLALCLAAVLSTAGLVATGAAVSAATPPTLDLKVLLIGEGTSTNGEGSTDPTTAAWESALTSEGVPYTEVDAAGTAGSRR